MALQYCQVCGVLIPNAPAGVDATICEKCFGTRKLIIAGDETSDIPRTPGTNATTVSPDRVQFGCPSCQSVLALAPVKKRTKIKCPRCTADFYLYPDGQIESSGSQSPATTTASTSSSQSKLLADLKPVSSDLQELLDKVPEKKTPLASVLDSDRYASFTEASEASSAPQLPPGITAEPAKPRTARFGAPPPAGAPTGTARFAPGGAPPPDLARFAAGPPGLAPPSRPAPAPERPAPAPAGSDSGYELVADSNETSGGIDFADKVIEQSVPAPAAPADSGKRQGRIATARRSKDAIEKARREREERDIRAAEAQRHTLALMERKRREAVAAARLYALSLVPLVVALVFLASTTQETGFATHGPVGTRLADVGDVVRRGVEGWKTLLAGK